MENKQKQNNILIKYQKYYLIKEGIVYKILIGMNSNEIIIKIKNYITKININISSLLLGYEYNSIDKIYELFNNLCDENKVYIKEIINKKNIKINCKLKSLNKERDIELNLIYKLDKDIDYFKTSNYNHLKNEINELKVEINKLKKEINKLNIKNGINDDNSSPQNIKSLSYLTKDSFSPIPIDNSFTAFKSINNILYLIYANKKKTIISYNLISQKTILKIKNAHKKSISNFRHYLDEINKRDLVMSISCEDNNIKIWGAINFECILNITKIYEKGSLFSACLFNDKNKNYIITSNCNYNGESEPMKVYDFNGVKKQKINNSDEITYYVEIYYDKKKGTNYIVTGNVGYVKSYEYCKNKIYHKYIESGINNYHNHASLLINNKESMIKLIETCNDGIIRIWNFHSKLLLHKIKVCDGAMCGLCLWNNDFLYVGCLNKTIRLIQIKNGIIVKNLVDTISINNEFNNNFDGLIITNKKIEHPNFGNCLISQELGNGQIKIWINNSSK